ncbi:mitochondrial ribosomal protein L15 [Dermatophagoides pteronyssinus]|uniref:Large ribosomal subunit protein uL15m n=1 Tax=Dermatophagoides pteronyssinus TaxID=6956 RepID=A0A6P6Y9E7_DERPT|nr:39S ribosomal protein L15, mitochondrial-like [Dermatophagoides pteronyssinus]
MSSPSEKALQILKYLPRVSLNNLVKDPYAIRKKRGKSTKDYLKEFAINKSNRERRRFWPVGYEGGRTPFYMKIPIENYYRNFGHRRQYPPLSLYQLQMLIDNGVVDPCCPIDLSTLCNSQFYSIDPSLSHYGVNLIDQGLDNFRSKINIEVQYTTEPVIAAIERNGGQITTAYFDIKSVQALMNPLKFFEQGLPIPKRSLPTEDAFEYYSNPKNRGYLADPKDIEKERLLLAQKYGYELKNSNDDPMMTMRKNPRQIFFGLEPGWLVNLRDQEILAPSNDEYKEYYRN